LLFFALIVILIKPRRNYNYWLSLFLFLKFLIIGLELSMWQFHWFPLTRSNYIADSIINYLLCPVFYLYVASLAQLEFKLNYQKILIFIPFAVIIGINFLSPAIWSIHYKSLNQIAVINYHIQAVTYFVLSGIQYYNLKAKMSDYHTRDIIFKLR
jgi:hypothetical protein